MWWEGIRQTPFFTPEPAPEPEPVLDPADVPLSDWAENRSALGIRHQAGEFFGLSTNDASGSGFPDWREGPVQVEQEPSELEAYSAERAAAGIRSASSVFGVYQRDPRSNSSPWSVV